MERCTLSNDFSYPYACYLLGSEIRKVLEAKELKRNVFLNIKENIS